MFFARLFHRKPTTTTILIRQRNETNKKRNTGWNKEKHRDRKYTIESGFFEWLRFEFSPFCERRNSLEEASARRVLKTVLQLKTYRKRIGRKRRVPQDLGRSTRRELEKIRRGEGEKATQSPIDPVSREIYRRSIKTEQRVGKNTSNWFSPASINGDLSYCSVVALRGTSRKSVVKVKEETGFLGNPSQMLSWNTRRFLWSDSVVYWLICGELERSFKSTFAVSEISWLGWKKRERENNFVTWASIWA